MVRIRHRKACQVIVKKKFSVNIRPVRINHVGLPRSGKTCFRRRLMGEIVNIVLARIAGEIEQPSTGVAEDGGQVIIRSTCKEIGAIRAKVWSILKDLGDEANMVNQFIYQTVHESPSSLMSSHSISPSANSSDVGSRVSSHLRLTHLLILHPTLQLVKLQPQ